MSGKQLDPPSLGPVSAAELPDALQLLFSRLDPAFRSSQIAAVLADIDANSQNQILLAARRGGRVVAIVWLQIRPGHVASLHPPGLSAGEPEETAVELVKSATSQAAGAGVRLVQSLLETADGPEARWLIKCGFQHAADLLHLVSTRDAFPLVKLTSRLDFLQLDDSTAASARLEAIIQRTYESSQDCPVTHGLQPIGDLLASYRGTGQFDPARWFIVRSGQADIGCLLLTEHPISSPFSIPHAVVPTLQWELLYTGVVPEARGHGWGLEIVRYAQWFAGQNRAEQLVLAVDAANAPAIAVYSAAGFQTWDRRSIFLRAI